MKTIDEHCNLRRLPTKPSEAAQGRFWTSLRYFRNIAYIYSNNSMNSESWIEPYLDRISKLCSEQGPSPYWDRAYNGS